MLPCLSSDNVQKTKLQRQSLTTFYYYCIRVRYGLPESPMPGLFLVPLGSVQNLGCNKNAERVQGMTAI